MTYWGTLCWKGGLWWRAPCLPTYLPISNSELSWTQQNLIARRWNFNFVCWCHFSSTNPFSIPWLLCLIKGNNKLIWIFLMLNYLKALGTCLEKLWGDGCALGLCSPNEIYWLASLGVVPWLCRSVLSRTVQLCFLHLSRIQKWTLERTCFWRSIEVMEYESTELKGKDERMWTCWEVKVPSNKNLFLQCQKGNLASSLRLDYTQVLL